MVDPRNLMIDNWVQLISNKEQGQIRLIAKAGIVIDNDEDAGVQICFPDRHIETFSYKDIEGIPLTSEILEKTEFTKSENNKFGFVNNSLIFVIYFVEKKPVVVIYNSSKEIGQNIGIEYLHELQNMILLSTKKPLTVSL